VQYPNAQGRGCAIDAYCTWRIVLRRTDLLEKNGVSGEHLDDQALKWHRTKESTTSQVTQHHLVSSSKMYPSVTIM
jgi:hypothetical protein